MGTAEADLRELAAVRRRHAEWLGRAAATLGGMTDVVGLVGMGSTADAARVDEWSDHDLAIIVRPGAERRRWDDPTRWMPDPDRIAASAVAHHGGGIALYDDGSIVEWGVDTVDGLSGWVADDFAVLLDRGGVAQAAATAAARPHPANDAVPERDAVLFLTALQRGVARVRRGERLSGGRIVREEATEALLRLARAGVQESLLGGLDRLDGLRRIEAALPGVAARVDDALARETEDAARTLLAIALTELPAGTLPARAVRSVTTRLGWERSG